MILYVFDMFDILLSGDSLRDLWHVYMHVCMYVCYSNCLLRPIRYSGSESGFGR